MWLGWGCLMPAIYAMLFLCEPERGLTLESGLVESARGKVTSGSEMRGGLENGQLSSEVYQDAGG